MIIAGHGRVLAAARLGLGEVPVMVARGWTEAQKRAYVIADNKLTENAGWDQALLRVEVSELSAMGFDVPLLGFSKNEMALLQRQPVDVAQDMVRQAGHGVRHDPEHVVADESGAVE